MLVPAEQRALACGAFIPQANSVLSGLLRSRRSLLAVTPAFVINNASPANTPIIDFSLPITTLLPGTLVRIEAAGELQDWKGSPDIATLSFLLQVSSKTMFPISLSWSSPSGGIGNFDASLGLGARFWKVVALVAVSPQVQQGIQPTVLNNADSFPTNGSSNASVVPGSNLYQLTAWLQTYMSSIDDAGPDLACVAQTFLSQGPTSYAVGSDVNTEFKLSASFAGNTAPFLATGLSVFYAMAEAEG